MPSQEPKIMYVGAMTITDIDPQNMAPFQSWDEADQFLEEMRDTESTSRWLIGLRAKKLPTEKGDKTFVSWCSRAGFSHGRVAVWRRMADLYDFEKEVKIYPTLSHKHFEVLMGRMAKAKRALAEGDDGPYEEIMTDLKDAADGHESSEAMIRRITKRSHEGDPKRDLPAKLRGRIMVGEADIDGQIVPCLLVLPIGTHIDVWKQILAERELTEQDTVDMIVTRFDTE